MSERTIAAISTPIGEGGIAVIRISGDNAIEIANKCFSAFSGKKLSDLDGYQALYGEITDSGDVIDDAVALVFRAPKSYTGEDVVEISVHGGRIMAKRALRAILNCGAVSAVGGEFTKRAFLNGKLDLTKAESIMELISAKNDTALKISRLARSGRISKEIQKITEKLLETAANLAVFADYPDEDIPELSNDNFSKLLNECENVLKKLISGYDTGRAVREGIDCVIVGKPNVGKSTLMNLLCGSERSIVTDVAGTTRDIIENTVNLGDITLNLADTAGIRNTDDIVEKMGVERATQRLDTAGIIFAVFDSSDDLDENDKKLIEQIKSRRAIVILNKSDLKEKLSEENFKGFDVIKISAKSGDGLKELEEKVAKLTDTGRLSGDEAVLISERQRDCVVKALNCVSEAKSALVSGVTLDAVGVCIDDAVSALLELTGKRVTNEVTDEVFRRFCVGK
ncbi:MAG: tRNA uridine-5-carboxymethylaminomethyl(34) synthesis GTPase MnmE [Clostridia bacterium]|nr:tRNA uridine-5-carboxymethylaminomethyl(34) synthesis GTPase MnmE [Clostridia bacterium]